MKQKVNNQHYLLSFAIILVLIIIVAYLALNSYYATKITALQTALNNSKANYNNAENQLLHPYTMQIYSNKHIMLESLFYPYYLNQGYNTSYLDYFTPTLTYLFYNFYNGTYIPLPLINSSFSTYNFNITENETGYLILNYTSNSSGGISLSRSDCLANLFTTHQISISDISDSESNGSLIIPTSKGENCLYLSNPSNNKIGITLSATFVSYPHS
ncbi:MAG: hypothetical protein M1603_02620 [Candidatus Marsarchaeota archaeon]|jgi:hypothetical protein|nr:hypothetical protein [Candidatus Marsarchaeota archaeon]